MNCPSIPLPRCAVVVLTLLPTLALGATVEIECIAQRRGQSDAEPPG